MIAAFEKTKALEQMFTNRVKSPLNLFANPDEPIEHVVISVVVRARAASWEKKLIQAAYDEQQADKTFLLCYQKYVARM